MKKQLSIIIIALIFTMTVFARSMSVPEVDFQTCGGVYVLDHYDPNQPQPFGVYDLADATTAWTAEGCTDFVFKPAGDGNYLGFGYRIEFAQ